MKYGRVDASGPEDCPEEGRLPGKWHLRLLCLCVCSLVTSLYQSFTNHNLLSYHSIDAGPPSPANHLREVFYRMGLDDKVIAVIFFVVIEDQYK